jgi:hypothetical protein
VADRWLDYTVDLEEGSSTMEFGQIVPLVLLILPLLAFAEIFYGELLDTFSEPHAHIPYRPGLSCPADSNEM